MGHVDELLSEEVAVLFGAHSHVHHIVVQVRGPMGAGKREVDHLHRRWAEGEDAVSLSRRVAAVCPCNSARVYTLPRLHAQAPACMHGRTPTQPHRLPAAHFSKINHKVATKRQGRSSQAGKQASKDQGLRTKDQGSGTRQPRKKQPSSQASTRHQALSNQGASAEQQLFAGTC